MTRQLGSLVMGFAIAMTASSAMSQDTLQIEGSTTVGPICEAFAEVFDEVAPGVDVTIKKTGSGDGAASLIEGRCDIAAMSRFMKPAEFEEAVGKGITPVPFAVAMDGVCVIVNPRNPVSAMTMEDVAKIYTGEITNWSQVGGPNLPIVPISRDSSSGTYEVFHNICMKKADLASNVEYANSNPQVFESVKETPGGIGYVGLGFVKPGVKAVRLNDVVPTKSTIASGKFPLARPLYLFTNGYPELGGPVHAFVNFYLSEDGQDIIEAKGFVPLTDY